MLPDAGALLPVEEGDGLGDAGEGAGAFSSTVVAGGAEGTSDVGAGAGVEEGVAVVDGLATLTSLDDAGASCSDAAEISGDAELLGKELEVSAMLKVTEADEDEARLAADGAALETRLATRLGPEATDCDGVGATFTTGLETGAEDGCALMFATD